MKKLEKTKLKKDAHKNTVTSVRLRTNQNNDLLLLTGSKDHYLNLYNINSDDFPKSLPLKKINTGVDVNESNIFGRDQYFFDTISSDNDYKIFNSFDLSPMLSFKGNNDTFRSEFIVKSDYVEKDHNVELYCGNSQ